MSVEDSAQTQLPQYNGGMPRWNTADLPVPPDFNFRNVVAIVGPGTIALSMSIGLGEWVLGPLVVTQYGLSLLWLVTLAIIFQLALNLEFIRYTVYTGEPVINGFMRLAPNPKFWGMAFIVLTLCHGGWPAWAAASAAPLFAGLKGHLPGPGDEAAMLGFGIMNFLICAGIIAVGGKIERTLEIVNSVMVIFIFGFLLFVCVAYVPAETWWAGIIGFVGLTEEYRFNLIPDGASFVLLGGFAAFAAGGGIANLTVSNYVRDKGYGMGSLVGYIPSAVGGKQIKVSPVGSVFATTESNLRRWRDWWKFVFSDQIVVWAFGCFVGMFLNCILAAHVIPQGTELSGLSIGAFQAEYLSKEGGALLGIVTLINGFWILFGSQLVTIDAVVRLTTDVLWGMSERVRRFAKEDIRRVYYGLLTVLVVWGCVAINLAQPKALALLAANAAGFILVVSGINILVLNHKVLPRAVQGAWWLRGLVVGAILFYGAFFLRNVADIVF